MIEAFFTLHCDRPGCREALTDRCQDRASAQSTARGSGWHTSRGGDYCPEHAPREAEARPLNMGPRPICQSTGSAQQVTRQYLAPLLSEPSAVKALRAFAEGKITAKDLQGRLTLTAQRTRTTSEVVRELVYRATLERFGIKGEG